MADVSAAEQAVDELLAKGHLIREAVTGIGRADYTSLGLTEEGRRFLRRGRG